MKKTIFTILLFSSINYCYSQTNTAWSTTGNIGIGTTSPSAIFEVNGTAQIDILSVPNCQTGLGNASPPNGAWLQGKGVQSGYLNTIELLYLENGDGEQVLRATNNSNEIYVGEINGSGDQAIIYFGDSNHFFKSSYSQGITIGTFGASTGITLKETSGNVGIGTSSPSAKLHVSGNARIGSLAGTGSRMVVANVNGDLSTQSIPTGDNMGNCSATANISLNGHWISNDGGNEGIKVDNNGNIGLGASPISGYKVNIGGAIAASGDLECGDIFSTKIGVGTYYPAYSLEVWGNAGKTSGGTTWIDLSDKRLKNVKGSISGAIETIQRLNPVMYDWNSTRVEKFGEDRPGVTKFGFLAQELSEVIPEFVFEGSDGYLRYSPSGIEAILVAAIKEQQSLIQDLQTNQTELMNSLASCCNNEIGFGNSSDPEYHFNSKFKSLLQQNRPNPFSEKTVISYLLMDEFINATIIVTDLNGVEKLCFPNLKKEGNVQVNNEDLYPGIFLYSLILDGEIVDTKRMVVFNR